MIGGYATEAAFRDALEHRLRSRSEREGVSIEFLRKRVVFERFLERLLEASDAWVLKGALALVLRSETGGRVTNDADLGTRTHVDEMRKVMLRASEIDRDDGFAFRIEVVDARSSSLRYRVHADLAGRLFDTVRVDAVSSDLLLEEPDRIVVESMLDFAGFASLRIPVLSLEQHLAEKVHAYTRTYAGGPSSRTKDLVDMVLIARMHEMDGPGLRKAMTRTFDRDESHEMPRSLPPPPPSWRVAYGNLAGAAGLKTDLEAGYEAARILVDPVLAGEAVTRWSPERGEWVR